jgi:putative salt-induced outer membrane protein
MKHILLITAAAMAFVGFAQAEEWKGNAELGFVQTGGNSDTSSLNLKGKGIRDGDEWRTTVEAGALQSKDTGATTSEKYSFSTQEDWKMMVSGYLFVRFAYEQDKFGGYNSRMSENIGYGFDILKEDAMTWNAELGGGARQSEDTAGVKTSDSIVRASTVFNWKISGTTAFSQELSTEGSSKGGYTTKSVTALTNQVAGNLSSKISYSVANNSKAPAGTKASDTILAASLVFSY